MKIAERPRAVAAQIEPLTEEKHLWDYVRVV